MDVNDLPIAEATVDHINDDNLSQNESQDQDDDKFNFSLSSVLPDYSKRSKSRDSLRVNDLLRQFHMRSIIPLETEDVKIDVDLSNMPINDMLKSLNQLLEETLHLKENSAKIVASNLQKQMENAHNHLVTFHSQMNEKLKQLSDDQFKKDPNYVLPIEFTRVEEKVTRLIKLNEKICKLKKELREEAEDIGNWTLLNN